MTNPTPTPSSSAPPDVPPATRHDGTVAARPNPNLFLIIGLILLALCFAIWPIDGAVHTWAKSVSLGGDIRRTLETAQQFGDALTVTLSCVLILLLDPHHRRRVITIVITILAVAACTYILKMAFGRPRPVLADPSFMTGPLGTYPVTSASSATGFELRSPWLFWHKGTSDLWSFPSSHTSGAAALGLSLWWFYSRLKWLVLLLIITVAIARVVLKAHYPSDVLAGAAVALIIAPMMLKRFSR
ncbi:MAG: phosphatase PAP2 family protein [Planctomycetes bacterium]|nr:phosphatase PAP2 family protein [Planctomycetota bacterium]